MPKGCSFKYRFEGPAIEDGSVDVYQLIPSLLVLKDALFTFHELLTPNKGKVFLNVKATQGGRFDVEVRFKPALSHWVASLFKVNKVVDEFTLVKCLFNLIQLHLWLRGRNPGKIDVSDDRSTVTYYLDSETYTTDFNTYQGFRSYKLRTLISQFLSPLLQNGIDRVWMTVGNENIVVENNHTNTPYGC